MSTQKPQAPRAIHLKRETLRVLDVEDLTRVGGGTVIANPLMGPTAACFIMKDTVIIPTSR